MSDLAMVHYWRGKRLEDHTKDELVAIVVELAKERESADLARMTADLEDARLMIEEALRRRPMFRLAAGDEP